MFQRIKLWVVEQRLRLHSGKHEAYLNGIRQQGLERDYPERFRLATELLHQPEFSRTRSWVEYQQLRNAQQGQQGG